MAKRGVEVLGRGQDATLWSPKSSGFDFHVDNGQDGLMVTIANDGALLTTKPIYMHPDDADHLSDTLKYQAKHQRRIIKGHAGRQDPA